MRITQWHHWNHWIRATILVRYANQKLLVYYFLYSLLHSFTLTKLTLCGCWCCALRHHSCFRYPSLFIQTDTKKKTWKSSEGHFHWTDYKTRTRDALLFPFQWHKCSVLWTKKDQMRKTTGLLALKHTHLSILIFRDSCETKESERTHLHEPLIIAGWRLWLLCDYGHFFWMFGGLFRTLPPGSPTLISSCKCSFLPQTESGGWAAGWWM